MQLQVKGNVFKAKARPATAAEKPDLWKTRTAIWPAYDDYQTKSKRQIPVVVFERA